MPPALALLPACAPQVATLKLEIAALKSEQDIREDELVAQVAVLQQALARKKKRRSPGKMLRKTWSQAVGSLKHGLQGGGGHAAGSPEAAPGAGPGSAGVSPPQPPAAAERAQPSPGSGGGGEVRRSWGSLKSKFGSLSGRGGSKEEEAVAAGAAANTPRK